MISLTPATLPLADGAKIVIQGIRRYVDSRKGNAPEPLNAGYVRPVAWNQYPGTPKAPHLLAQDAVATEANVFTVTVVPQPASFPVAKSFGPDCQFIVLRTANGKYLGFLDDDNLGADTDYMDSAQILLLDRGEPFKIYITPVFYGKRNSLGTFAWPPVAGTQLVFCQVGDVTLWRTYSHAPQAGAINLFLAGDPTLPAKAAAHGK